MRNEAGVSEASCCCCLMDRVGGGDGGEGVCVCMEGARFCRLVDREEPVIRIL